MSIFGSPVFDGVGGFNSGSYASDSLNVALGSLIVCLAIGTVASGSVSLADTSSNSYTSLTPANDGTEQYSWFYCLSSKANSSLVITATFGGSPASFGGLATWVVPVTGSAVFDVISTLKVMSGTGNQLTNTFNTAGADEIGFCSLFDRNGNAGWSAVSPATLDSASFASSRSAADHLTWSSPQTGTTIGLNNAGSPLGAIQAVTFMAGNISVHVSAADTESFSETLTRVIANPRVISESHPFSETLTRLIAIHISATDVESFNDGLSRFTGIGRSVSDSLPFSDFVLLREASAVNVFGFSPNYYFNQESAGLSIFISPGIIGSTMFNGQVVAIPANVTTNISIDKNAKVYVGLAPNLYPIARVVAGQVVTSGSTGKNANTSNGIISITDIRPGSSFAF